MAVQRLSGEGEMSLTQGFVLRRMSVDVRCHITGVRFPTVDQLRFTDQLADPGADHVNPDDGTAGSADELDEACGFENPRSTVSSKVVGQRLDLAVGRSGGFLGQADCRDLRIAVRDTRYITVLDRQWGSRKPSSQMTNLLGYEDAVGKAAVGQLRSRHEITDGIRAGHGGAQPLVRIDEATAKSHSGFGVAQTLGVRPPADGHEHELVA